MSVSCDTCKNGNKDCPHICLEGSDYEPMTNADRIRNMTDTELADFVTNIHQREIDEFDYIYIVEGNMLEEYDDILIWLQAEVKEGAEHG